MSKQQTERIKAGLRRKTSAESSLVDCNKLTKDKFLSSGSTLLNLACTGRSIGAFVKGHYYFFVGDSDSGKTFFVLTSLAEASINPNFDGYRFIYDATELGALMDFEKFFGSRVAERVEPPSRNKDGTPRNSYTVQEFYYNVDDAIKKGSPFIYILDSQDGLSSKEEISKFMEHKKAYRKKQYEDDVNEKKPAGSFGDGKARVNSSNLRQLMTPLAEMGSILIIISQTRDSFSMFEKSTYSGGRSLKFYATLQMWSSQVEKINRRVRGKDRELGICCKVRVKKNRITGRDRTIKASIFHSCGIDDLGSMCDYLCEEKVWSLSDGVITVKGIGPEFLGKKELVIQKIYEEELEDDVRDLVESTWNEIEEMCVVKRRNKYE